MHWIDTFFEPLYYICKLLSSYFRSEEPLALCDCRHENLLGYDDFVFVRSTGIYIFSKLALALPNGLPENRVKNL